MHKYVFVPNLQDAMQQRNEKLSQIRRSRSIQAYHCDQPSISEQDRPILESMHI